MHHHDTKNQRAGWANNEEQSPQVDKKMGAAMDQVCKEGRKAAVWQKGGRGHEERKSRPKQKNNKPRCHA